jgi:hypothetical protein
LLLLYCCHALAMRQAAICCLAWASCRCCSFSWRTCSAALRSAASLTCSRNYLQWHLCYLESKGCLNKNDHMVFWCA